MRAALIVLVVALPILSLSSAALAQQQPPGGELGPLEQRVTSLRADVGRTEARLRGLFGDDGSFGVARIAIAQENHMAETFRLQRAQYAIDGQVVFLETDDDGSLAGRAQLDVYGGALATGAHVLSLSLTYRLDGYGIFEYLRGYTFTTRSSTVLSVPQSGVLRVRAILYERGMPAGPMEERPSVLYRVETDRRGAR